MSLLTRINQVYLSNYETGRMQKVTWDIINTLAEALDIDASDVLVLGSSKNYIVDEESWKSYLMNVIKEAYELEDIKTIEMEIKMILHLIEAKKLEIRIDEEDF